MSYPRTRCAFATQLGCGKAIDVDAAANEILNQLNQGDSKMKHKVKISPSPEELEIIDFLEEEKAPISQFGDFLETSDIGNARCFIRAVGGIRYPFSFDAERKISNLTRVI
jgi:hypothetical protein